MLEDIKEIKIYLEHAQDALAEGDSEEVKGFLGDAIWKLADLERKIESGRG